MENFDPGSDFFPLKPRVSTKLIFYSLDILKIILGNVEWALDLAKYLVDDLFELADNIEKQPSESTSGPQPCMSRSSFYFIFK